MSHCRMANGREFQRVGAAMAKALSPTVRYLVVVMGVRRLASEERSPRVGEWRWRRSVRYGGARFVESLERDEEDLEMYALFYGEPVQFLEDRGDVFSGGGAGEQTSSGVLDIL